MQKDRTATTPTKTKSYVLKRIPADLWVGVKMRAAKRDETVRAAIIRLLTMYAK